MDTNEKPQTPGTEKPKTIPVQPSTDPQQDRREQNPGREIPDVDHEHEVKQPAGPNRKENK